MEHRRLAHLHLVVARVALPQVEDVDILGVDKTHLGGVTVGAFAPPMDQSVHPHGVKDLDYGLVKGRLHYQTWVGLASIFDSASSLQKYN